MKIVVLDGFTLNPGDLSWADLEALGKCVIHDRTPPGQVVSAGQDAEILLTNKTPITQQDLQELPRLRYISVLATGYNIVDVVAARARAIPVSNVPAYGTKSVAQATFALLLELTHHIGHHAETVRQGRWSRNPDFCYWDFPLVELDQLTMGIIGFGRIGQAVGELAKAFGMRLLVYSRKQAGASSGSVEYVDLETIFRQSDVLSLHCPLTPETRHIVNAQRLSWMKSSAFLLNTSRGPLVDDVALADALNRDQIAGAGLDVLSVEPPPADNSLFRAKNCLITPHLAWATRAARLRLMNTTVANVKSFLVGKPQNVVN